MNKIVRFAFMIMAIVVSMTMNSCGGSDDEGGNTADIILELENYKWVSKSQDYGFGDDYVTDYQDTYTLYFVNDHQCVVYHFQRTYDTDFGTSYEREGETVTYSISGKTITIGSSQYTASRTLTYSTTTLTDQNGGVYERQSLSSDDYDIMNKYFENTDFQGLDEVISKNVTVTSTYEDLAHHVQITSKLSSLYPNNDITYGVEYGDSKYQYYREFGKNGKSYSEDVSVCIDNNELYISSVKALDEKIANGKTLTSDEKSLYTDCIKSIKKGAVNFKGCIYVEIEDQRYYVYDLPKLTSSEVEKDIEKYHTGNKDNGNKDEEDSSTDYKSLIVGTWTVTMDDPTWKCTVTFSSNGTFTSKEYYDEYGNGKFSSYEGSYSGKWTISGSKITINPSDENSVMDFVGTIKSLNSTSGKFTDSDGWSIYLSK